MKDSAVINFYFGSFYEAHEKSNPIDKIWAYFDNVKSSPELSDYINVVIPKNMDIFELFLENNLSLQTAKRFIYDHEFVFIKIHPPTKSVIPPGLELRFYIFIGGIVEKAMQKTLEKVVFYSEDFSPGKSHLKNIFSQYTDSDSVLFLNKKGESLFDNKQNILYFENVDDDLNYRKAMQSLERKLISRVGYFGKKNKVDTIDRVYFDASNCANELSLLIETYVKERIKNEEEIVVLCDDSYSSWLMDPVESLNPILFGVNKVSIMSINEFLSSKQKDTVLNNADHVFIFYPLIDTRKTLNSHIRELMPRGVEKIHDKGCVHILGILFSGDSGDMDSDSKSFISINSKHEFSVDYLLRVKKDYIGKDSKEFGIISNFYKNIESETICDDKFLELTSFDFWYMLDKSGIQREVNVPPDRSPIDRVPNLKAMFENFGSWLCYKIIEKLKDHFRDNNFNFKNYLVVTLDEDNINIITENLSIFSDFDVCRVHRDDLIDIEKSLEEGKFDYLKPYDSDVIILDDFTRTGDTINCLRGMLETLGKKVCCSFVMFSFIEQYKEQEHGLLSLYDLSIPYEV
ncbi:MAG: phosphoribosyltransferase [Colwellia sp.]|nr:phosphoribosyltransferase [Colwellia sp.]